jgi:ATP-dependent DNA helicase UvrD (EC 3.6.1.-)
LQDAARLRATPLSEAVDALGGRGAASLQAFLDLVAQMRFQTAAMSLPELVRHVLEASGLNAHYREEREGQERLENLEELVNAAAAFVTQEGFGLQRRRSSVRRLEPRPTASPPQTASTPPPAKPSRR